MNKKLAHLIIIFFDLLCFLGLWFGYHEIQRTLMYITNQADIIEFGNRVGFFIVGLIVPFGHIIAIVEYFNPELIKTYNRLLNYSTIVTFIILFGSGFIGSSWIKSRVENADYIYCSNASGVSALAKTLVYTRSIDICEELVKSKRKI